MLVAVLTKPIVFWLFEGEKPVPVKDRDIGIVAGGRVPAEQVVVKDADLARFVVVADVVEVSLGEWDVERPERQQKERRDAPWVASRLPVR
jgi:hypothetical protein